MISITCHCRYTADLFDFTHTPISGDLPPGHFQCPKCGIAWRRHESEHRILRAGSEATIVAGRVDVVLMDSRL
jgi:hypothetical protein